VPDDQLILQCCEEIWCTSCRHANLSAF